MKNYIIAMISTQRNCQGEITHCVNYYETSTSMGHGFGMSFWGDDPAKAQRFIKRPAFMDRNHLAVEIGSDGSPMMTAEQIISHMGPSQAERLQERERKSAEARAARAAMRQRA